MNLFVHCYCSLMFEYMYPNCDWSFTPMVGSVKNNTWRWRRILWLARPLPVKTEIKDPIEIQDGFEYCLRRAQEFGGFFSGHFGAGTRDTWKLDA